MQTSHGWLQPPFVNFDHAYDRFLAGVLPRAGSYRED
jgi:hypothetical protein